MFYNCKMQFFTWNDISAFSNGGKKSSFFKNGCGISVGSFDGLHRGHRFLLESLNFFCKNQKIPAGVFTFSRPLPSIKYSKNYGGDISTLSQRIKLFENAGLDFVVLADFDEDFASMPGLDFFSILTKACDLKIVAEGVDFRCGYKGATDIRDLKIFCEKENIRSIFVNPVFYDSADAKIYTRQTENFQEILKKNSVRRVSSSLIRELIRNGDFSTAEILLARKFSLDFSEFCDDNRNLKTEFEIAKIKQILPKPGKYRCKAERQSECEKKIENEIAIEITIEKIFLEKPATSVIF